MSPRRSSHRRSNDIFRPKTTTGFGSFKPVHRTVVCDMRITMEPGAWQRRPKKTVISSRSGPDHEELCTVSAKKTKPARSRVFCFHYGPKVGRLHAYRWLGARPRRTARFCRSRPCRRVEPPCRRLWRHDVTTVQWTIGVRWLAPGKRRRLSSRASGIRGRRQNVRDTIQRWHTHTHTEL